MPPQPLRNFEIQKYFKNEFQLNSKNEPKFNGVFSRKNLPKIKYGAYVINADEYESVGTHSITLYLLKM